MKRIFALVLTLAMLAVLLPAGTGADAAQVAEKPFYVMNMGVSQKQSFPYVYSQTSFYAYPMNSETEWPRMHAYGTDDEYLIAEKMKEDFNNRPDGTRYFQLSLLHTAFFAKVENIVYFEKGVEMVNEWLTEFLTEYKRIGGKLDGIVVDLEYIESHSWYLQDYYRGTRNKTKNENIYADIVNDPRYATELRPLLEERGFKFYENPAGEKSEIWCVYPHSNLSGHDACTGIWNTVMDQMERQYINEAVLEPLLQFYPDAYLSDYQSGTFNSWEKALDNFGGLRSDNVVAAGNTANYNSYSCRPENAFYVSGSTPIYRNPPSYNEAVYEASPFNMFMYDVNLFKSMYASTDDGAVSIWISDYMYNIEDPEIELELEGVKSTFSKTPYYAESIFHFAMLDPKPFLGFAVTSRIERQGGELETCLQVMSDAMAEITRILGAADRKPIQTPASWNGNYTLSGMYAGGRNVWRLTPDTNVISLKDFKVKDKAPTFCVDGVTITFPQGRIISDGNISEVGTCGYWIETPSNVTPVITSTADRYQNNPAFLADFEEYTANTAFTSQTALPETCWNVTGTAQIQAVGSNKVLALSGDTTVKNLKLPQNITAGDEYAKQQAWEVTVTLPENLSANAEIVLMDCLNNNDVGVKIAGGKVYYNQTGTYQLLDGVTLSAGTYTVKREVDFRTKDNFTSSFAVYDASGKLLKEVKNVSMQHFNLPITTITTTCTNANVPILIDNYKLYPTGLTTVLELFDGKFGTKLADTTVERTTDTGYRVSWLNATAEYKVAYVYDTKTGNVVEKFVMAPGMDGVQTGEVKVTAGKSVTLAVKVQNATTPAQPNYDKGKFDWVAYAENPEENMYGGTVTQPAQPTQPSGSGDSTVPTDGTDPTVETVPMGTDPIVLPGTTDATDGTEPSDNTPNKTDKKKVNGGVIALIVILCAALAGGGAGFAVYWFVLKPKQTPKETPAPAVDVEKTMIFTAVADISAEEETPATQDTPAEEEPSQEEETPAEQETPETETEE